MTNPINRYLIITIDGKEYKLQYTIKAIIMLEKALTTKSILKALMDVPLNYSDTLEFFRWGIYGGGLQMSADEVDTLFLQYLDEYNIGQLQQDIMVALANSGAVGKVTEKK